MTRSLLVSPSAPTMTHSRPPPSPAPLRPEPPAPMRLRSPLHTSSLTTFSRKLVQTRPAVVHANSRVRCPAVSATSSAAAETPARETAGAPGAAGGTEDQGQRPIRKDAEGVAGKTVIVTGANTGMGLVIAQELALQGADVIMACRSEQRGQVALDKVKAALEKQKGRRPGVGEGEGGQGSATLALVDLASLESVRKFVTDILQKYPHVDQLICNAGIMIPPHSFTKDGFESQFQVNHLSHFLLTRLLLPSLLNSPNRPKIVHVSSLAGEVGVIRQGEFWEIARKSPERYNAWDAYRQSKLAQVLFTVETSRRYGEQVTVNAVHPGIVNTDLFNRWSTSGGQVADLF